MKLPRDFYARPCLDVARALVGKHLVHRAKGARRVRSGRIVEVEAYVHEEDQACHARFGRTPRASLLFGPPGHAYVFLIYGMYDCFNVVCEPEHSPAAVLVRAVEPDPGVDGRTDGPGKLCRALGITRALNGADLTGAQIWLEDRGEPAPRLAATPRIGVDYAGEWALKPWRFVDADSAFLSRRLK
ncbi:MAG TPA: DNA-3-methyladenine glycosylase [Polyangia bacterium]|nr:DNA-3-methyladenine glycosylase [Polyangia bacterium]